MSTPDDIAATLGGAPAPGDYAVAGPPRIAPAVFHAVLTNADSPAIVDGGVRLYELILTYGLDPAAALAFFGHESRFGTKGRATANRGWGNVKRLALACVPTSRRLIEPDDKDFARYASWADGLHDWCAYIRCRYIARGLITVAQIVPVYAPRSDGNVPTAYIAAVCRDVATWQRLSQASTWTPGPADVWAQWGTRYPLPSNQRHHSIPRRWFKECGQLGAAQSLECYDDNSARSLQWFERGCIVWLGGDKTEVVR